MLGPPESGTCDIALTKVRRDLRRLNQRIALLETDQPLARDGDGDAEESKEIEARAEVRRSAAS
jgi:hypothetical protein